MQDEGLTATWSTKYNAGANPIAVRLGSDDLQRSVIQELLRASHAALAHGAESWSERVTTTSAEANAAAGAAHAVPAPDDSLSAQDRPVAAAE
jgi:hypothetical protein